MKRVFLIKVIITKKIAYKKVGLKLICLKQVFKNWEIRILDLNNPWTGCLRKKNSFYEDPTTKWKLLVNFLPYEIFNFFNKLSFFEKHSKPNFLHWFLYFESKACNLQSNLKNILGVRN